MMQSFRAVSRLTPKHLLSSSGKNSFAPLATAHSKIFVSSSPAPTSSSLFTLPSQPSMIIHHQCSTTIRSFHTSRPHQSLLDEGDEVIVLTCGNCGTQQGHAYSTEAHDEGVVMVLCPNCGSGHIVSDNLAWFENDENTIDYRNKIRELSLKEVTTKFEITTQELKELGLFDKVMERKAKWLAENPEGDDADKEE